MEKEVTKRMVDRRTAARMFSVSPGTLANWFCLGRGPKCYRVNRKISYKIEDLEAFFTSCPIQTIDSLEGVGQ